MPQAEKSLVKIGVIVSAHGIKGQVKVRSSTGNPEDILAHSSLVNATGIRTFKLTRQGIQKDLLIAGIEGISDRNEAELLKGTELFAPISSRKKRPSNQWTYAELTGLKACLSNGKPYGKIIGVYDFGAGPIIELELVSGRTEMLPFTDDFTGEVDLGKGTVIVTPPEYIEAENE